MATAVHWSLAKKYAFNYSEKWYQRGAEKFLKNKEAKLMWDQNIFTAHIIEARRPDIVPVEKKSKKCFLIDIAVPGDVVVKKKNNNNNKYRGLCKKIRKGRM